jgi:hypothetical protein
LLRALGVAVTDDKQSAWLQKLDEECPYQVVLPRRRLMDDSAIMDFLLSYEPMDAAIFRSRFRPRSESFRLAG